jgi:hypothetical protein
MPEQASAGSNLRTVPHVTDSTPTFIVGFQILTRANEIECIATESGAPVLNWTSLCNSAEFDRPTMCYSNHPLNQNLKAVGQ